VNGPLIDGDRREVFQEDMEYPAIVETYTIPQAAKALGMSEQNMRRWINEDMVPAPYLGETTRGLKVYSRGEIEVLARQLAAHQQHHAYYCAQHESTRHAIFQHMQAYRVSNV